MAQGFIYVYNTGKTLLNRDAMMNYADTDPTTNPKDVMMQFQYNPAEIEITRKVNWASNTIPGKSHNNYTFINGGTRVLTFTLEMFKPIFERNPSERQIDEIYYVQNKLKFLESLTYPSYSTGGSLEAPPPIVCVVLGHLFSDTALVQRLKAWELEVANAGANKISDINTLVGSSSFRGVITDMNIKAFYLFDPYRLVPQRADVGLTIEEVRPNNSGNRDNRVFRGLKQ